MGENSVLRVSMVLTIFLLSCMGVSTAFSGNVITSGTKVKVLSGTSSVSVSDFTIQSGATLNNAGTLVLKKGLTNLNTATNPVGQGTVKLTGTTLQTLTGQNAFQNMNISNPAGVTIGGNTSIDGILTLTSGTFSLGSYNLLLGPSATISGTPSSANMIIVTSTGELRKNFPTGFTGSFTFPVGDNTNTPEYSPVTLNFFGGTFGTGNYAGVNLRNLKYPDPLITGNYLNRYWSISQSGITGLNCNAVFQYVSADVTGNENLIKCLRITPLPVITYALANTATHQLTASAITSFGTYTGASQSGPSLTGPTQVCATSTGNVYTTDPGKTNYQWIISSGGTITAGGTTTSNTVTITWNTAGSQTVSVNYSGFPNPTVLNVIVNPKPVPTITGPASSCVGSTGVIYSTETEMTGYTWTISPGGTITGGSGTNTITVTWNTTGSNFVKVNYQNISGCTAATATTKQVYVNILPVPTLNGPSTECLDNVSTYYTETGQTNYDWSVSEGGTIIEGYGSTENSVKIKWISRGPQTVSISYTNSNGCSPATPTVKNVTVNPIPVPSIMGPESVNLYATYEYSTIDGMTNYAWTVSTGGTKTSGGGPGDSWVKILWIATGSKTVSVNCTNNYGCSAAAPATLLVFVNPPAMLPGYDPTSNNESDIIKNLSDTLNKDRIPDFSVYPVPNDGRFTISINSLKKENYTISIFNYLGVEVYNLKNLTVEGVHKQQVDISSVNEGIYMVIIRNAESQAARRVIIRK